MCLSVHRCICVEKKHQLNANEWFIVLIICSTCFGHFYAHHQEFKTICVLLPPMVCSSLVAGCRRSGAGQQAMCPGWGMLHNSRVMQHPSLLSCTRPPTPSNQTLHTIGGNNTHIVSSSWWCAWKCPKHVEHIISAINHSVASSWFFFFTQRQTLFEVTQIKLNGQLCYYVSHTTEIAAI